MGVLKYFLVFVFYGVLCNATFQHLKDIQYSSHIQGVIENSINTTLNKIRANLTDPISVASKTFDFGEGEVISGIFNISNLKINGVKDFVAKEIKADISTEKVNIKIAITEVVAHFKYWADVVFVNLVPIYGHGRIGVSFDEIELDVQAAADVQDTPKIKDTALLIYFSEATFDVTGLIDNPEFSSLISNVFNDNFANFVNHNSEVISEAICPIVETIINSILDPETSLHFKEVKMFVKT